MLCGATVCVLTLALCAGHGVRAEALVARDFGVKLCGREFIRAVIFTCGGSRWRRSMGKYIFLFLVRSNWLIFLRRKVQSVSAFSHMTQIPVFHHPPEAVRWRDKTTDTSFHKGSPLSLRAPPSSSSSLEDLLSLRRQLWDTSHLSPVLAVLAAEDQHTSGSSRRRRRSSRSRRRRRHFSLGVAGICCSQGCNKNDIGLLC
uniref:prorelaxin H1 n=1 Tax=Doryrhamphus excisus TaxID=161450 RepID=UPI0025AE6F1F|nr:prorelaxin H1 [Doryrhamphus excisus]